MSRPLSDGVNRRSYLSRVARPLLTLGRKGFARLSEFVPRHLNLSWVSPQLAVGGAFDRGDVPRLARLGVSAVVDMREEAKDDAQALAHHGITFLHLPTPDAFAPSQEQLVTGVRWVLDHLQAGCKVLIHCQHGAGRGPIMASAVLVAQGHSPSDALQMVRAARWQSGPNSRQLDALLAFYSQRRLVRETTFQERDPEGGVSPTT